MQRTRHAALLAMGLALALAGCASDPNRLVGPNYGRKASAFVAPALPALPPDPALPDAGPSLVRRVVLIGDAGNPTDNEATLSALGRWGDAHAERSRVIFLGDNLYPAGLREDDEVLGVPLRPPVGVPAPYVETLPESVCTNFQRK